jgi:hypothetical protein
MNRFLLNENSKAILRVSERLLGTISSGGIQRAVAFFERIIFHHNWSGGFEECERGLSPFVESGICVERGFLKRSSNI